VRPTSQGAEFGNGRGVAGWGSAEGGWPKVLFCSPLERQASDVGLQQILASLTEPKLGRQEELAHYVEASAAGATAAGSAHERRRCRTRGR
jgi:hypothetical protein